MPGEGSFSKTEDAQAGGLLGEAQENLAVRACDRAFATVDALLRTIERVRPVRLNHKRAGTLREALDVPNIFRRITSGLLRVLSECAGNKDEVYGSGRQLCENLLVVFDFTTDDRGATQTLHLGDGSGGSALEEGRLRPSETLL